MSAERIANSLSKEILKVKVHKPRNLKEMINLFEEILKISENEIGLRSNFLEKIIKREFDHKALIDIANNVCSKGVQSKAVISCKKDPMPTDHGILSNVPILIKDCIETFEFPLTLGTEYYEYFPSKDSEIVAKLRASGAIILGVTNMHELALGTTGINEHYGTPINPICPDRIPGGSSSGSASAVAQNLVPIALGNDAAGSIRVPASFTGIVGFKFSKGFIDTEGSRPWLTEFVSPGIFAKSSLDLIPIFESLKTYSSVEVLERLKVYLNHKEPIRILIPKNLLKSVKEPVLSAFEKTIEIIKSKDINLKIYWDELSLPPEIDKARVIVTLAESFADYAQIYDMFKDSMEPDTRLLLDIGKEISARSYLKAKELIKDYRKKITPRLIKYDIALTPTVGREPPKLNEADWRLSASTKLIELTTMWNVLESAAINLPSPVRLPCGAYLGIQLSTLREDENLLALSIIIESILKSSYKES